MGRGELRSSGAAETAVVLVRDGVPDAEVTEDGLAGFGGETVGILATQFRDVDEGFQGRVPVPLADCGKPGKQARLKRVLGQFGRRSIGRRCQGHEGLGMRMLVGVSRNPFEFGEGPERVVGQQNFRVKKPGRMAGGIGGQKVSRAAFASTMRFSSIISAASSSSSPMGKFLRRLSQPKRQGAGPARC